MTPCTAENAQPDLATGWKKTLTMIWISQRPFSFRESVPSPCDRFFAIIYSFLLANTVFRHQYYTIWTQ